MSTSGVNTTELRSDDKIVDENDQELPVGTVMHCLKLPIQVLGISSG